MRPIKCCKCGMVFGMPEEFYTTAKQLSESMTWYCPAGHPQHFVSGGTEAEKVRRERDILRQRLAMYSEQTDQERRARKAAERSAAAYKGAATRMKNRAKAGVCPCCNRTFQNLARHMATQHPDHETDALVEAGQDK